MLLSDLINSDRILIQCHDNPDADAIASGYALYIYFKQNGVATRFVYAGKNKINKSNLTLLIKYLKLETELEYVGDVDAFLSEYGGVFPGLLLTVDCQYGAGNVTKIPTKDVAIIDHHQVEITDNEKSVIMSDLGSCSTVIWKMLKEVNCDVADEILGTALYYGLYSDTNAFGEIYNPNDKDMRDQLIYNKTMLHTLKNTNFSLEEFEIAGKAIDEYKYVAKHRFAYAKTVPCDPNILGLISDFMIQVAEVDSCIVYNEEEGGYKFSLRSCIKDAHANEMAAYISEGIGNGGGHLEKAGGFLKKKAMEEKYPNMSSEEYLDYKMNEYFETADVIEAKNYDIDLSDMEKYIKKKTPMGYVVAADVLPIGTPIRVRTLEGDVDMEVTEDLIIMIGIQGEVYPNRLEKFNRAYEKTDLVYKEVKELSKLPYQPMLYNRLNNHSVSIEDYAQVCISSGDIHIYARELDRRVKIYTAWDNEKYMLGVPGDYIAARCDDVHDIYVINREIFFDTYERYGN